MAVTYTFSTQSGSIPLAQLDANFATPITIGNTSVQLGNTITTLNNITLANTTISSGNVTLTNVSITTANVTTANITNAVIGTANVTTANITSGVIATANITTGNVGTLTLTNALGTASGGTGLTSFTSGGVVYASSGSALSTGSALTFNGTNLGIGTSSPTAKLDVNGGIYASNAVALALNSSGSNYGQIVYNTGTGDNWFLGYGASKSTAGTAVLTWNGSGNVGIGTSSPARKLDVAATMRIADGSSVEWGGTSLYIAGTSNTLLFATSSAERMRLDSSGNLGIATSPSAWGSSYRSLQITDYGTSLSALNGGGGATALNHNIYNNGTNWTYIGSFAAIQMQMDGNGGCIWNTAPSGTAGTSASLTTVMSLSNTGNLTVPAMYSTTVTTPRNVFIDSTGKMGGISSTRASKTNISQLDTASWIYELNPVTFNYLKKDEEGEYLEEFEEEQQFGLIAEEVELVKPELCIYTDDKVSGIHYDRMIAPLIKAIQELKASNDALTARIAQLEAK
jgi:hypothetical protein